MSLTTSGFGGMSPMGKLGNKIPKGYKSGQMQQFTPEQMQLFQQMFSNVSPDSYLSKLAGGDEGLFNEMEEPALRQFAGLQGNLASRFSGMGMGARRSSGFQNTMTSAASDFAKDLQSQRQNLQRQAIQDLMGLSSSLLGQRPYEQFLVPKKQSQTAEMFGKLFGAIPGMGSSLYDSNNGSFGDAIKGGLSSFSSFFGG